MDRIPIAPEGKLSRTGLYQDGQFVCYIVINTETDFSWIAICHIFSFDGSYMRSEFKSGTDAEFGVAVENARMAADSLVQALDGYKFETVYVKTFRENILDMDFSLAPMKIPGYDVSWILMPLGFSFGYPWDGQYDS